MRCPKCDGGGCITTEDNVFSCDSCHGTGIMEAGDSWPYFWTPAERAGLKAMGGRVYSIVLAKADLTDIEKAQNREAISIILYFVRAARKVKEAK